MPIQGFPDFSNVGSIQGFPQFGQEEEEDRGILGTIISEIGKDLAGTAKFAGALAFSPFDIAGLDVPISFGDLESRDWQGAFMTASMFVGGAAFRGISGIRAGVGARAALPFIGQKQAQKAAIEFGRRLGAVRAAGQLAASEAAAGAFFGAVRPLHDAEGRLQSILTDSAFFAGGGAAMSFMGSAFKATLGAQIAQLKGTTNAAILQREAKSAAARLQARELAGTRLQRPGTDATVDIVRRADGTVEATYEATTETFKDYNTALQKFFGDGYIENLGMVHSRPVVPEGVLGDIMTEGGDIASAIGELQLSSYRATREFVQNHSEQRQIMDWLGIESIVEAVNPLGVVDDKLVTPSFRRTVLEGVTQDERARLMKIEEPTEFLKETVLAGLLDTDALSHGVNLRDMATDLMVNDLVPTGGVSYAARTPNDASFLAMLASPSILAKVHPEIAPLVEFNKAASNAQAFAGQHTNKFLNDVKSIPQGAIENLVRILDDTNALNVSIREADDAVQDAIGRLKDPNVQRAYDMIVPKLNEYRLRAISLGRLGASDADESIVQEARKVIADAMEQAKKEGLDSFEAETLAIQNAGPAAPVVQEMIEDAGQAGYFPILHLGEYRLEVKGVREIQTFKTFNDAMRAAADQNGGVVSRTISSDGNSVRKFGGKGYRNLVDSIDGAEKYTIGAEQAEAVLADASLRGSGPRKYSRYLQQRRVGLREYGENVFDSLENYMRNMDRTFAYNKYDEVASAVIDQIPDGKGVLKRWALAERDILLGRQTMDERWINNIAQALFQGEVSSQSLRRYSGMMRRFQGISKLGGALSGLVNSTQFAINTVPILGTKYSSIGLKAAFRKQERQAAEALLQKYGIDLGFHTSFLHEGQEVVGAGVTDAASQVMKRFTAGNKKLAGQAAWETFENLALASFNGFEKMNRMGTFWGGYQRAIAPLKAGGKGLKAGSREAVEAAVELVNATQFNYHAGDIPQLLKGPVFSVLGQFKTFFIKEIELLARVDAKTRLKMLAMFQALGGAGSLLALPAVEWVDGASRFMFDTKISEAIKFGEAKAKAEGETVGGLTTFMAYGLPGMKGFDTSNYIGPGGFSDMMRGFWGPTAGDIGAVKTLMADGMKDISATGRVTSGTYNAFLQRAMPAQIRRLMRGSDVLNTGDVRNAYSGRLIYRADDRLREATRQAVGIPTTRLSTERAMDDFVTRRNEEYNSARGSFRKQIALAAIAGNTREVSLVQQRALAAGISFTPSDIRKAVATFQKPANERRMGRSPVALRDDLMDFYDLGG